VRATLRFPTIIPGVLTIAGHIYTPEVLELVLNQIRYRLPWIGSLECPQDRRTRMTDISHQTLSINKIGINVYGEIEVLDTPQGKTLQTLLNIKVPLYLSPLLSGSADPDGTIHDNVKVVSLNIICLDKEMPSPLDLIVRSVFSPE
jgi:hypothetical protein